MPDKLLFEIHEKYGEWLEEAGDKAPDLFYRILATMIINLREENKDLKRMLDHERTNSAK